MNKNFGERLKQSRMFMNKHQSVMARKIGVSPSAWSRWETGTTRPDFDSLYKMGELFGLSLDYLVLGINARSELLTRLLFLVSALHDREVLKIIEWLEVRLDVARGG